MDENNISKFQIAFGAGTADLFAVAKRAADRAPLEKSNSGRQLSDDVLVTIIFSALSVEAFLNDLTVLDWQVLDEHPSIIALDDKLLAMRRVLGIAEDSNVQSTNKLILLHEVLGKQLDPGEPPLQDYILLKQLRDSIVHSKPTNVTVTLGTSTEFVSSRRKIIRALESRGLLSRSPSCGAGPFLAELSNASIASWALKSASAVVRCTVEALPDGLFKDTIQTVYRDFMQKEPDSPRR